MDYSVGLGTFLATENVGKPSFEFSVFPNPASEEINVKGKDLAKISKVEIFDITGKLVLEIDKPFVLKNNINISKLSPGIYIIKLGDFSEKFIKK